MTEPDSDASTGRPAATSTSSLPHLQLPGRPMAIPALSIDEQVPPAQANVPTTRPSADFTRAAGPQSPRGRPSAVLVGGAVLLVAAIGAFAVLSSQGTAGFTSAAEANTALFAAARTSGSFHYMATTTGTEGGNTLSGTVTGDAARTDGIQYLRSNIANYEVIVFESVAYMKPDEGALENVFDYPPSTAATYANRWIELLPSDAPYSAVAADVTTGSAWNNDSQSPTDSLPHVPLTVTAVTSSGGRSVQTVTYSMTGAERGASADRYSGKESIVFSARSPHVPFSLTEHLAGTADGLATTSDATATFSNWGEAVHVAPPTGAIPFSSLPPPPTTA